MNSSTPKQLSNLEIANEIFKTVFLVKRERLHQQFPELSDSELDKKTAEYIRELPDNQPTFGPPDLSEEVVARLESAGIDLSSCRKKAQ